MANDGTVRIGTEIDDSGFRSGLSKLGSVAKAGLKATGVAISATSAAIGALSGKALQAYASYEQLVGGVETLFKESASVVQEYAANAYKTAGVSANTYMEQATAFSASLIQSLGGDTKAAAEYANQAIMDMSDNANKMGTSIESIQLTYQSLMRGNYAMLDNLKLGYGGTKKELERLVSDAENLTGKALDPSKFSDVITAINAVQTNLGITGTTAKEAATTIEGSVNAAKAAFENLLVGIADDNANLETLIDNFVTSFSTAADNILPRLTQILSGAGEVIQQLAPIISQELPNVISSIVPSLVSSGSQLVLGLVQGIIVAAPELAAAVPSIIQSIVSSLQASAPMFMQSGSELLNMIAQGILTGLPVLAQSAVSLIGNLAQYFQTSLPTLIETGLQFVTSLSESIRENAGLLIDGALALIMSLANGLIASLPALIEYIPQIITNIAGIINDNAPKLLSTAAVLIKNLAVGLIKAIPTLVANIPQIIQAIIAVFTAFNWLNLGKTIITKLKDGIVAMVGNVKASAQTILQNINGTLSALPGNLLALGRSGITGLINGLKSLVGNIGGVMKTIFNAIINGVKSLPSQLISLGKNIIQGLINGIKSGITGLLSIVGNIGKSVYDKIAGFFDIHSPSRLMLWVGQMIMTGLGNGMKTKLSYVQGVAEDVSSLIEKEIADTQDKIAQIEKEAQEKQAADELAEHKKQIAEKYAELEKAEISERENIRQEIADLEQEWADKQAEAAREAEKEKLNAKLEELESYQEEYEKRLQEIQDLETDMFTKLADYGDLFTRTKKKDKEIFELGDLRKQIDEIDAYSQKINELKTRGVSVELMDEILGMSVEDATEYMDALLAKTPEQLDEYIALFEEKQEKAKEVAKDFWKTDYAELEAEFAEKIPENISGLKDEMYTLGTDSGTAISDGIKAQSKTVENSLLGIVGGAIASATGMLNTFILSLSSQMGSIQGRMTAAVVSATPTSVPVTVNNSASAAEYTTSRAVKAIGGLMDYYMGAKNYDTSTSKREIVLTLNGTEVARALVDDIRKVEDQSPRIVSD